MIHETLYTIALVVMAVALMRSWRKNIKLERENLELYSEVKELEGYTSALHNINTQNVHNIAEFYKSKPIENQ